MILKRNLCLHLLGIDTNLGVLNFDAGDKTEPLVNVIVI